MGRHLLRRTVFVGALLLAVGACRWRYESLELEDVTEGGGATKGGDATSGGATNGGAGGSPVTTGGASGGSTGGGTSGGSDALDAPGGAAGAGGAADGAGGAPIGPSALPCGDRCVGGNCYRPPSALHLAVSGASVVIPDARALDLGKQFTIEFWMCVVSYTNAGAMVLNKFTYATEDKLFQLPGNGRMTTRFFYGPQAPDQLAADATSAIPTGQWTHVATAYGAGQVKLFINGSPVASASSATPVANGTGAIYLGTATRDAAKLAGANIILADLRWSSTTRYSAAFSPEPHLLRDAATRALWQIDDGKGTTVTDSGPNGLNGSVVGGAVWLFP